MKVKLHPSIDLPGQGFLDPAGQKIRAGHPKPGEKFQKGKIFEVEKTDFVIERIKTGELVLVEDQATKATVARAYSEKEKKVILEEAEQGIRQLKDIIKVKGVKPEIADHVNSIIEEVESALKAKDVDRVIEAMAKAEQPMLELLDQATDKKGGK